MLVRKCTRGTTLVRFRNTKTVNEQSFHAVISNKDRDDEGLQLEGRNQTLTPRHLEIVKDN